MKRPHLWTGLGSRFLRSIVGVILVVARWGRGIANIAIQVTQAIQVIQVIQMLQTSSEMY